MSETLTYPIHLDRAAIQRLLPHRGEMQLVQDLVVLDHNRYQGRACWQAESAVLQGHFPGLPIVPGVMLVELVAQIAGAGMLAGSPAARRLEGAYVGMLASIRKCSFKRPVLPGDTVLAEVQTRPMSDTAASVNALLTVEGAEAAQIEILLINAPRAEFEQGLLALKNLTV
jgi:3-hydroxyacyl-[acyl-carrier-protein] dehydratase